MRAHADRLRHYVHESACCRVAESHHPPLARVLERLGVLLLHLAPVTRTEVFWQRAEDRAIQETGDATHYGVVASAPRRDRAVVANA